MASKSWLNFLVFLCGSAIGFFLCSQLLSILLREEAAIQPNMLHNDPHARHSDDNGHSHLKGQMNFNADSSQHKGRLCVTEGFTCKKCVLFIFHGQYEVTNK
jgi:glycoprotein-N-acetylgalactosamine 3-beta-galactosyltransferase